MTKEMDQSLRIEEQQDYEAEGEFEIDIRKEDNKPDNKQTKKRKRVDKTKEKRKRRRKISNANQHNNEKQQINSEKQEDDLNVDYVQPDVNFLLSKEIGDIESDPAQHFLSVFKKFQPDEEEDEQKTQKPEKSKKSNNDSDTDTEEEEEEETGDEDTEFARLNPQIIEKLRQDGDVDQELLNSMIEETRKQAKIPQGKRSKKTNSLIRFLTSKKKIRKQLQRLSIAQLKKIADKKAYIVEQHDTTAPDVELLLNLKSYKNVIPVPDHWTQKRKYLQSKRGVEKGAFKLPDHIKDTGIQEVRDAQLQKEEDKSVKSKQRDTVRPKLGRGLAALDYEKLHDAFFLYQKRPKMTGYGEIYYEGKENDVSKTTATDFKPGCLSDRLRQALGMPEGNNVPPPWLINMQRAGPPPAYPKLKIPGVNAPIPEGCNYGFNPGEWGKAPTQFMKEDAWVKTAEDLEDEGLKKEKRFGDIDERLEAKEEQEEIEEKSKQKQEVEGDEEGEVMEIENEEQEEALIKISQPQQQTRPPLPLPGPPPMIPTMLSRSGPQHLPPPPAPFVNRK